MKFIRLNFRPPPKGPKHVFYTKKKRGPKHGHQIVLMSIAPKTEGYPNQIALIYGAGFYIFDFEIQIPPDLSLSLV